MYASKRFFIIRLNVIVKAQLGLTPFHRLGPEWSQSINKTTRKIKEARNIFFVKKKKEKPKAR